VHARGTGVGSTFGSHNRPRQDVVWDRQRTSFVTLKLNARRGNAYENKGPLWKTRGRSGDVIENKGTCGFNPRMLLRANELNNSPESVRSFFGAAYRVVHVRETRVGRTFGRHNRPRQDVALDRQRTRLVTLELKARCGNLYENKGSLFRRRMRSGNVIENTDSYSLKAGMSLKKQHVSLTSRVLSSCRRDSPSMRHPTGPRVGSK